MYVYTYVYIYVCINSTLYVHPYLQIWKKAHQIISMITSWKWNWNRSRQCFWLSPYSSTVFEVSQSCITFKLSLFLTRIQSHQGSDFKSLIITSIPRRMAQIKWLSKYLLCIWIDREGESGQGSSFLKQQGNIISFKEKGAVKSYLELVKDKYLMCPLKEIRKHY